MYGTQKPWRSARALAVLAIATVCGVGLLVALDIGVRVTRHAADQERDAALAAVLAERATAKLAAGDLMAAELYAAEALGVAPDPSALGTLLLLASRWRPSLVVFAAPAAPICSTVAAASRREVLACGGAGELLLWQPLTGEIAGRIANAAADAAIAMSPRGTLVAAASFGAGIGVWDVDSGLLWRTAPDERGAVIAVAFSADGSRLLVGGDSDRARLLDAATGETLVELVGHNQRVCAVAYAADGDRVATSAWDQTIRLWDPHSGEPDGLLVGHDGGVTEITFSSDGARLASVSEDRTVRVWRLDTGEQIRRFDGHGRTGTAIAFSADGRLVASGDAGGAVRIWDVEVGRDLTRLSTWGAPVRALLFRANNNKLVVAGAGQPLRVWDLDGMRSATPARQLSAGLSGLRILFADDGELLATTDQDGTVRLWDARGSGESGAALTRLRHPAAVRAAAFSPDGELLATGCDDGNLRLWRVADGELSQTLALPSAGGMITDVTIAPDGTRVFCSRVAAATAFVSFRLPGGQPAQGPTAVAGDGLAIAASVDGRWLAGGTRQRVYLWEAVSGREVWHEVWHRHVPQDRHGAGARAVRFSRDSRELYATGWDNAVHAWSVPSGRPAAQFAGGPGMTDLQASAGDQLLAGLATDGAWLWEISSRRLIARFAVGADFGGVALAPDGSGLGLLERSGVVRRVDLETLERPPELWLSRARAELGGELRRGRLVGRSGGE